MHKTLLSCRGAGLCSGIGCENMGNQAKIPCGSTADLYANPSIIYFTVTLTAHSSSCKPVNSGDWVKKLLKQKGDVHFLDIDLEFGGGSYFACLRLSRGQKGVLEVVLLLAIAVYNLFDIFQVHELCGEILFFKVLCI